MQEPSVCLWKNSEHIVQYEQFEQWKWIEYAQI